MRLFHIGLDAGKSPETSLMKTFKRHVDDYIDINTGESGLSTKILKIAQEFQPDFTFMQIQAPGVVSKTVLQELNKFCPFIVNWTGDVRFPLPEWYIETGQAIQLTLFTNMPDVEAARQKGINADFLPIGYDPDIYFPSSENKSIDVAFFGNNYITQFPLSRYRTQIVELLKRCYGNRFRLYGSGWKHANGNINHSQHEEAKELRKCKIAVNLSHFQYAGYSSDRLNRILGCGIMCLTHEFPKMDLLGLEDGKNCVVWRTENELIEKIDHYLKNDNEREQIAKAGHRLAMRKLTFDVMIEKLLQFNDMDKKNIKDTVLQG